MAEWAPLLISALGGGVIGSVLTKLIDVSLAVRAARKSEQLRWLREQRLRAFSNLAKDLLSLGLEARTDVNPLKGNALAAESVLLIEDKALVARILAFPDSLLKLRGTGPRTESAEHEEGFNKLREEALSIVDALKTTLLE